MGDREEWEGVLLRRCDFFTFDGDSEKMKRQEHRAKILFLMQLFSVFYERDLENVFHHTVKDFDGMGRGTAFLLCSFCEYKTADGEGDSSSDVLWFVNYSCFVN